MKIKRENDNVIIIQDSRYYLKKLKRNLIIFEIIVLFPVISLNIIYAWILFGIFSLNLFLTYIRDKKIKFIYEKMIIKEKQITILHLVNNKTTQNISLNINNIKRIYYEKPYYITIDGRGKTTLKEVNLRRFLKIILDNNEIISFGFFISKEEAKEIQKIILERKLGEAN